MAARGRIIKAKHLRHFRKSYICILYTYRQEVSRLAWKCLLMFYCSLDYNVDNNR